MIMSSHCNFRRNIEFIDWSQEDLTRILSFMFFNCVKTYHSRWILSTLTHQPEPRHDRSQGGHNGRLFHRTSMTPAMQCLSEPQGRGGLEWRSKNKGWTKFECDRAGRSRSLLLFHFEYTPFPFCFSSSKSRRWRSACQIARNSSSCSWGLGIKSVPYR